MSRIVGRGRRRVAVVAALVVVGSFAVSAAPAAAACTVVNRVLANGDPLGNTGALRVTVDGLGAFGSALTGDPVLFAPPDLNEQVGNTVFMSSLYSSLAGEMMVDDCEGQSVSVIESAADRLRTVSAFGNVQLDLVQQIRPIDQGGSTLVQTYTFENIGQTAVPLRLVRHLDTDLFFDETADDGAASRNNGASLIGFDSSDNPQDPTSYVGITGKLGQNGTPNAWAVQPFKFYDNIVAAGGIPEAARGVVVGDTSGDGIVDDNYDVTLSQQWNRASLGPGATAVFVTRTRFGRAPANVPPTAPDYGQEPILGIPFGQLTIDVLAGAFDPDDEIDDLEVVSYTQGAHGTVTCERGVCTYTRTDFEWPTEADPTDSFDYTIEDPSGGQDTGTVTITGPVGSNESFAQDDQIETGQGSIDIPVTANDDFSEVPDGNGGFISPTLIDYSQGVQGGEVFCAQLGPCTYTSPPGFVGTDLFTYTLGRGDATATADVAVLVRECPNLTKAISGQAGLVTGQEWIVCAAPEANGTSAKVTPMMPAPQGSFGIMTTGDRAAVAAASSVSTGATTVHNTMRGNALDASVLRLDINVPEGNTCLSMDAVFASEEYPQFLNSQYNDAFVAQLGEVDWNVVYNSDTGKNDVIAPGNFAEDGEGNVLNVNSNLFDSAFANPAADLGLGNRTKTEYNAATRQLRIRTPIESGTHSVFLSIFDVGDAFYDSGVFLDRMTTGTPETACTSGAETVDISGPGAVTSLEAVGKYLSSTLSWNNPGDDDFARLVIRKKQGLTAAADETDGTKVLDTDDTTKELVSAGQLEPGKNYTFTAFAFDNAVPPNRSAGRSVRVFGTELARTAPSDSPATITDPDKATLRWVLRRADNDTPLPNRTLQLWGKYQTSGTYGADPLATAVTNANGVVTFTRPVKRNWDYKIRFAGGSTFVGRESDPVRLLFRPLLTAKVDDATLDLGERLTITGAVSPYYEGDNIHLQELVEGEWTNISTKPLGAPTGSPARSTFAFGLRPATSGSHSYRVLLPAQPGVHLPGRSQTLNVEIA